jgi:hypothetical protein
MAGGYFSTYIHAPWLAMMMMVQFPKEGKDRPSYLNSTSRKIPASVQSMHVFNLAIQISTFSVNISPVYGQHT